MFYRFGWKMVTRMVDFSKFLGVGLYEVRTALICLFTKRCGECLLRVVGVTA